MTNKERRYLPTFSELVDRLTITQIKEVLIKDHKEEYAKEIEDILHDIEIEMEDNDIKITSDMIRDIIVLSQINLHIWYNESKARNGENSGENLRLTHGLNGIRNTAKNRIQNKIGGRKDYKVDCLASEFKDWEISWKK